MNLQNRFLREKSFEHYSDSSVLETLLSAAGVRGDIPAMITSLYDAFGSFKGILEARPEQLLQVPHVTEKAATMIAMITPLARVWERCTLVTPKRITNAREAQAFAKFLLMGERTERFYVIALNTQCHVLGVRRISEGSLSEVSAYPRSVAETALNYNAHSVLFAHNHPGSTCAPSAEDIASTLQLQRMLSSMNVQVVDHMGIKAIEDAAFDGIDCQAVIIPEGCESVKSMAFANCRSLVYVQIPQSVLDISDDAFDGCESVVIDYAQ